MPITINGTTDDRIGLISSSLGAVTVNFDGTYVDPGNVVGSMNPTLGSVVIDFDGQYSASAGFDGDMNLSLGGLNVQIIGNQIQTIDGLMSASLDGLFIAFQDSSVLEADYNARISQPGVVWHHNFSNDAEVDEFRWRGGVGNDPNDTSFPGTVIRQTADGITGGGCLEIFRPTGTSEPSTWWRPFSPIAGADNGRGQDDPGASGTLPPQSWNSDYNSQVENWADSNATFGSPRPGYYGHEDYHDGPKWDGTDYWLQFRIKMDPRRWTGLNAPQSGGKILYFTLTEKSLTGQELVTASHYAWAGVNYHGMYTSGSPSLHSQDSLGRPGQQTGGEMSDYDAGTYCTVNTPPGNAYCWSWSGGWDTVLYHITPGHDNFQDPGFEDNRVEVWAANDGETKYTKIWDTKLDLSFDTVAVSWPDPKAGWNALICSGYSNSSQIGTVYEFYTRFDEIVFSKDPILLPQSTPTNLEARAADLVSANTPVKDVHYFMSEDGSPQVVNNRTPNQNSPLTYGCIGIYYDPIRRHIHQLDKQHAGSHLEHAVYDEIDNQWTQVTSLGPYEGVALDPSHWRGQGFDPNSGIIYYMQEAQNHVQWYDPYEDAWQVGADAPVSLPAENDGSTPYVAGFHPNLFGFAQPGFLVLTYRRAMAWNITDETWHQLNSTLFPAGTALYALSHGEGWYIPETDELLLTGRGVTGNIHSNNFCIAIDAGAGNLTNLSEGNGATVRNKPPKPIGGLNTGKYYACMHPRQPNVLLGFDAANPAVCWYTDDAGVTPWTQAPFTTPFATELNSAEQMTVGSLPYHGVVAGADTAGGNNTKFCFWRPPLV